MTCPKLCCKEIRVTPKIKVLSSGTLPQILDLENFVQQEDGVVNITRRQLSSWITPTTVERVVAGCTKFITRWSTVTAVILILEY